MNWEQIIVALLTGGFLTALVKGVSSIIKKKMELKNSFPNTINRIKTIYMLMDELKADILCDRVLIMSTKNGGGIPRPGAHLYASILYETYDKELDEVMSSWQNRQVDLAYVKLLSGIEERETIVIYTENMSKGILKDIYMASGIEASILSKVKATETSYYYVSCNFKNKNKVDIKAKVKVADIAAKIRDII